MYFLLPVVYCHVFRRCEYIRDMYSPKSLRPVLQLSCPHPLIALSPCYAPYAHMFYERQCGKRGPVEPDRTWGYGVRSAFTPIPAPYSPQLVLCATAATSCGTSIGPHRRANSDCSQRTITVSTRMVMVRDVHWV